MKIAHCLFKLGPDRRKRPVPVRDNVLAIKGCVSLERDGSPGPPVGDLGQLGSFNLRKIESVRQAQTSVLREAGALPHDATSARMVRETRTGTGRQGYQADISADRKALIARESEADSDRDGLPDDWELAHGLDPKSNDSRRTTPSGYTHLERFCHEKAASLIDKTRQAGAR